MSVTDAETPAPTKGSKLSLLLGLVLAIAGGAGGFVATTSGLLPFGSADDAEKADADQAGDSDPAAEDGYGDGPPKGATAFVPIDPLVVNLPSPEGRVYLRFTAQMEVPPGRESDVAALMPRIVDVLNGYLRAIGAEELDDPAILHRLRGQMLRRIQIITGADAVRDLLIMEFILN